MVLLKRSGRNVSGLPLMGAAAGGDVSGGDRINQRSVCAGTVVPGSDRAAGFVM